MANDRRYRSDDRDLDDCDNDLVVMPPDGNGDFYVSVLPHGHKIGPTVRVTTSGGPRGQHGVCTAVARLYRAMSGEEEDSLVDAIDQFRSEEDGLPEVLAEALRLVIAGLHGAADERRAREVAGRLAELGVTGVDDLPDAVCMAESLAAARRALARKRAADESIAPPADLGPRIEEFCEQHKASTGQRLTEQEAVRLLLVVGLETAVKVRRCPHCHKPFPTGKRRHARWCSDNCRKATGVRKAQRNQRVSAVVG